jgi:hypothetical protein
MVNLRLTGQVNGSTASISGQEKAQDTASLADPIDRVIEEGRKEGIMEAVQRALENCSGTFNSRTIVEFINKTQRLSLTERDVANPLWRLRKSGDIRIFEKGKGRKPSTYLRV